MANLVNLYAESGASLVGDDTEATLTLTNTGAGAVLNLTRTNAGNYSIAALSLPGSSVASGAVIQLSSTAFTSAVSLIFAAGANWAGMGAIRVRRPDNSFGWIPVLPDGQVTGAVFAS